MKLSLGLAAGLAGIAAAASQSAPVYFLDPKISSTPDSETPSVPRQLARLVFLQRLSPNGRAGSLKDVPDSVRTEDAISYLNSFGKPPRPLLADPTAEPTQLLVLLEGTTANDANSLSRAVPGWKPAFTVADPPSAAANLAMVERELAAMDLTSRGCSPESLLNPLDDSCVHKGSRVLRLDARKVFTLALASSQLRPRAKSCFRIQKS